MENDFEDIVLLEKLNEQLLSLTDNIISKMQAEAELRIKLIQEIALSDIDDKISFDNKLIKLFKISPQKVRDDILRYLAVEAEIKMIKMKINQVQEAINSTKKAIDIRP